MYRFTRLAITWLAVGGVAVLVVLHYAGARGPDGPSSVNNQAPGSGRTTELAGAPKRAAPISHRAIIATPPERATPAADAPLDPYGVTRSIELPCLSTTAPAPQLLPSTVTDAASQIANSAANTVTPLLNTVHSALSRLGNVGSAVADQVDQTAIGALQDAQSLPLMVGLGGPNGNECVPGP